MYQENELKKLYERLKAQYPQYQLELSGDNLILKQLYCKVEVNRSGVKIYVNGNLYDQFTSDNLDDWADHHEQSLAVPVDFPPSSSVPRCTKTNSQKNLSAILDLPGLRTTVAYGHGKPFL